MDFEKIFESAECEKAILRIADGDGDALKVIHQYMNRQIYAVAYSVLRDFSLSDDVVQGNRSSRYWRRRFLIEKGRTHAHGCFRLRETCD